MELRRHRSPGRPRSHDKDQPTHEIIIKAASRLFLENGYKEVSIDDVANSCGVTKATVYYYYATKAELFTETMIQMMERIRKRILSMLQEDVPLRDKLLKVANAHLKATIDIDLDGIMRGTKNSLSEKKVLKMQKAEDQMYQSIEMAFKNAIENKEIVEIDPTFATHSYIALLKIGTRAGIFRTTEEAAERIVSFFWNGLFPAKT